MTSARASWPSPRIFRPVAKRSQGKTKVRTSSLARGAKARKRRGSSAALDDAAAMRGLPALESLARVPAFDDLAPSERQRSAFDAFVAACDGDLELELGFVCRLDRNFPAVRCASGLYRAEHAERIYKGDLERPAVGDWVVLRRPEAHDVALIEEVLPREQALVRWRGSQRGDLQVLAANVELVLIAQPLGREALSLNRIARSAVVAADSGAEIAVLLTKADRAASSEELAHDVAHVRALLGERVRVLALCALDAREREDVDVDALADATVRAGGHFGLSSVRELLAPQTTALVLGESGAGKSTLLNALLGEAALKTSSVRRSDDAGRHTTVARRMVKVPDAGVVIDCPGLRNLPLVGHESGLEKVFGDVMERAWECRFRDCTHHGEPGCALAGAEETGELDPARVEAYISLADEMRRHATSLDPDVTL